MISVLWTLFSSFIVVHGTLQALDDNYPGLDSAILVHWWLDCLIPLDSLTLIAHGPKKLAVRAYNKQLKDWVLVDYQTFKPVEGFDDSSPAVVLDRPLGTDLGFLAFNQLFCMFPGFDIYLNLEHVTEAHLACIPRSVYAKLLPDCIRLLCNATSVTSVLNHYVEIGLEDYFWERLYDRSGKSLLTSGTGSTLLNSSSLGLTRLSDEALNRCWDQLMDHLRPATILMVLNKNLWSRIKAYAEQTLRVPGSSLSPYELLTGIGLRFSFICGGMKMKLSETIINRLLDPQMLRLSFTQRIHHIWNEFSDIKSIRMYCAQLVRLYWSTHVAIRQMNPQIVKDYLDARMMLGTEGFKEMRDPVVHHMYRLEKHEFDEATTVALYDLWPLADTRSFLFTLLVVGKTDLALQAFNKVTFSHFTQVSEIFAPGTFDFHDFLFALLLHIDRYPEYRVNEGMMGQLRGFALQRVDWNESSALVHLILIHQSLFYTDPIDIPDEMCQAILTDIALEIPKLYFDTIPALMQVLGQSCNPFAYMRYLTEDHLCAPSIAFLEKNFCAQPRNPHGYRIARFEALDLRHRRLTAMFSRRKSEFSTAELMLRYQWWMAHKLLHHTDGFKLISEELAKRFPGSNSLDFILESFREYFSVPVRSWEGVWNYAMQDPILTVNLLAILNFRSEAEVREAVPCHIVHSLDDADILIFSVDAPFIQRHLRECIVSKGIFGDKAEDAQNWLEGTGTSLLIELIRVGQVELDALLPFETLYMLKDTELAAGLNVPLRVVQQLMALSDVCPKLDFYVNFIPLYPELPIRYLADVYTEHGYDASTANAYILANTKR